MHQGIASHWNALFLGCVLFCVVFWLAAARSPALAPAERPRALGYTLGALLVCLGGSQALSASGWLDGWGALPPPAMRVFMPTLVLSIALGLGPVGRYLRRAVSPAVLVGAQVFRLPLELTLHGFYEGGAIPVQMTFEGRNFDVVSGLLAIPVALLLARGRVGRRVVIAYNVLGLALLANIVVVALLSMPTPLRAFEGLPNTLVVQPYYVWLPMILVQTALLLHLASLRGATSEPAPAADAPRPSAAPAA